tara:strand:+ start:5581 stop:6006 length:426 start_codon:yes stop_codon:yes gene_type:complete
MIEIKKFKFKDKKLMQISHAIRYNVFVIGQKCPANLEWEFEEESTHFLVFYNNNAVATARHRKTTEGYKLERFAVPDTVRGQGYGHMVLKAILDDLKSFNETIYMHAQSEVIPFYEKMGFIKEGIEFKEAGIMHYKMILKH